MTLEPAGHGVVSPSQRPTWVSWIVSHALDPHRQLCALWQQIVPSQSWTAEGSNESLKKQKQPSLVGEHETARQVQAVPGLGQLVGWQQRVFGTSAAEHWNRFAGSCADAGSQVHAAP
jgi:hypothetical protein